MVQVLLQTLGDPAYWIQCVSAAFFTWYALRGVGEEKGRSLRAAGEVLLLIGVFAGIHIALSALTLSFRILAGVGTWFSYLGGVAIFARFFSDYSRNAKVVTGATAFSAIITVFELGAVLGRFLEYALPGTDSLVVKTAACLLLLVEGGLMGRFPVCRYYVSIHAARLSFLLSSASALAVMIYDLFTVHVFYHGGDADVSALMSVVLLSLFLINTVAYLMTYHLSREYTSVMDLTAENQMNKSAASLMAVTEENLSELHKIRHDIRNQYAYMGALMDSGDYAGLRDYFEELTSTFAQPLGAAVDYGNHAMNLIFHMEDTKARSQGVALDIRAAVPHQLPFSDLDLVKLYTNVIDNAIEACAAEEAAEPKVAVAVSVLGEYLFTRVSNPTTKSRSFLESGSPTTKADARIHGKGISIVRGIVGKYGGTIRYAIEEGRFIVEFMLCLKEASHE